MTTDEIMAVMQAHKDGKRILCRWKDRGFGEWIFVDPEQRPWNFAECDYSVERRKPRDFWLVRDPECLVRPRWLEYSEKKQCFAEQIHVREIIE